MSIPLSKVISVNPRVLSNGVQGLNFNGLFLTKSDVVPVDTLLTFGNASEVAEYFGYESAQYKAALSYFNGYENSFSKPRGCFFFRHVYKDAAAYLRGAPNDDAAAQLTDLNKISNGYIDIYLGPDKLEISGIDFSKCASLSDAATVLQDCINDAGLENSNEVWTKAKVRYSAQTRAFTITAGVVGNEIAVDHAVGPVAQIMRLDKISGGILSRGCAERSYMQTMDKAYAETGNFATYATIEEVSLAAEAEELAQWANNKFSEGALFLYVWHTSDVSLSADDDVLLKSTVGYATVGDAVVVNAGAGRAIAERFIKSEPQGVCGVYGDSRYAAFIMGAVACIDWNQPNASITFAFKSQSGLPANVSDVETYRTVSDLKLTLLGDFASRNDSFKFTANAQVFGNYNFIDTYVNAAWLVDKLQTKIASSFVNSARIGYDAAGRALIAAFSKPVFQQALLNGVITSGLTLSTDQKEILKQEAGIDISTELSSNGYYLQVLDADTDTRNKRASPPCRLWYTYSGAVHSLNIAATAVV